MSTSMAIPKIAERFARDTAEHKMTIRHDDGLYRHVEFRRTMWRPPLRRQQVIANYWFDLVIVPGALIFQGDGESYVFRRLPNMFEFFRDSVMAMPEGTVPNLGYWAEKLTDDRDRIMPYQQDMLVQHINETVTEAVQGDPETLAGLADAVRERVLEEMVGDESYDRKLVDEFAFWANDRWASPRKRPDFQFVDSWEWPIRAYDWWYEWACHAIVWGIGQYDAHRARAAA